MTQRSFLWITLVGFLVMSCSVSKTARVQNSLFNGSWTLDNISYESNKGAFTSVLFNDVKDICFEGSEWFFRNNNSTGTYTIPQGTLCEGGNRFFRWSVVVPQQSQINQLQFKFIDANRKDISGGYGYRLDIITLNESAMILKSRVSAEGEPVTVVYKFTKK